MADEWVKGRRKSKAQSTLEAIRMGNVGDDIIVHNLDGSIWCILRILAK